MAIETTYSNLRRDLSSMLDRVDSDREVVVVKRRRGGDVALVSADELAGLMETAHLLRSPANAARLMSALKEVSAGRGNVTSVAELKGQLGLTEERKPARGRK